MPVIEKVNWLDPHTELGWAVGDNGAKPESCWSVGKFVSESDVELILAADWCGDETNTRMILPKGSIVSRTVIDKIDDE